MSARVKRLQKVKDLRNKALEERVKQLAETRAREEAAKQQAIQLEQERSAAFHYREKLALGGGTARDWHEANEWCAQKSLHWEVSQQQCQRAAAAVEHARAAVLSARGEVKKLELLQERLLQQDRLRESRAESRQHDETASQLVAANLRRG